jgi:hypothetical protein
MHDEVEARRIGEEPLYRGAAFSCEHNRALPAAERRDVIGRSGRKTEV